MVPLVEADGERQHESRDRYADYDTCEHEAAGDGVYLPLHLLNAVCHDGRDTALDIAHVSQEQVGSRIHDIEADYFLKKILLQKQVGKADYEEYHRNRLNIIRRKICTHSTVLLF